MMVASHDFYVDVMNSKRQEKGKLGYVVQIMCSIPATCMCRSDHTAPGRNFDVQRTLVWPLEIAFEGLTI